MASYPGLETIEEAAMSIFQIQNILESDGPLGAAHEPQVIQNTLEELQRRLMRVRSLGGEYSELELSPDIRRMVDRLAVAPREKVES